MKRTWVRIFISLFAGGAISEAIHICTGDPNRPQETNFTLLFAAIIFIILSIYINRKTKKTF